MLFNLKWEVETKAPVNPDIYALPTLIAWLEKQDPHEEYCWMDSKRCLLGRYASNMGVPVSELKKMSNALADKMEFWDVAVDIGPFTFGAALKRARALL